MSEIKFSKRKTRIALIQTLFQYQFYHGERSLLNVIKDIENLYEDKSKKLDLNFIENLAALFIEKQTKIDHLIQDNLKAGRSIEELSINLLNTIRSAICEMIISDTDLAVIINEYIEVARLFEDDKITKFVNGILDTISKERNSLKQELLK